MTTPNQRGGASTGKSYGRAVPRSQATVSSNDQEMEGGRRSPHFKQPAHASPERQAVRKEL